MNSIKSSAILVQATIIALSIGASLAGCGESSSDPPSDASKCPAGQIECDAGCCINAVDDCPDGACPAQPRDCGKNETKCGDLCCNDATHECNKVECVPIGRLCVPGKENPSNLCEGCADDGESWVPRIGAACNEDGGSICDGLGKCARWRSVATGYTHTCGVTVSGTAMCWGDNSYGELGNGKGGAHGSRTHVPQAVIGLETGVVAVSAGGSHSCAVTEVGSIECWGQLIFYQTARQETLSEINLIPVQVLGPESGAIAVSSGYAHACAVTSAGGALCWGWNYSGQLGDGTLVDNEIPQQVVGLDSGVKAIATGIYNSCALSSDKGVVCWESLGTTTGATPKPVWVPSGLGTSVSKIACGAHTKCLINSIGGVMCWGDNSTGQIGDDGLCIVDEDVWDDCWRENPTEVTGLVSGIVGISVGMCGACALTSKGSVKCWGCNHGDFTKPNNIAWVPMEVPGLDSNVVQVAEGSMFTCAVTTAGEILCWGNGKSGQLGSGFSNSSVPIAVVGY